jgi:hypothetical protein
MRDSLTALAAALAVVLATPAAAAGQGMFEVGNPPGPGAKSWLAERATLPPYDPARMSDGRPDLRGRWGGSSSGDVIEDTEYVDVTTPAWESHVSNPAGGKLPYQPWALAARDAHRAGLARGWPGETGDRLHLDPQTFCVKSAPRYAQRGFDLAQTPDHVAMMLNWGHVHRSIPIAADSAHPTSAATFWMGSPRGHWEGDTLVVEVTNINGKMWLDSVGNFYSDNARVVERFRLVSANQIDYEVRIEDPTVFTEPVTLSYDLQRDGTGPRLGGGAGGGTPGPYASESWEHACHEGNTHHVQEVHVLGFKWYKGAVRPE